MAQLLDNGDNAYNGSHFGMTYDPGDFFQCQLTDNLKLDCGDVPSNQMECTIAVNVVY